ncbi:MAG: hypothetical protein JJU21_18495 [Salinarimonas sp.]|nr:hypothetical protein [Salinarimonas sp.]
MTYQNDPEIRRCTDGAIDVAFYESRARGLRGEAILRSPSQLLAQRAHGQLSAADKVVVAIRSVKTTLSTVRHAAAGKLFPG